MYGFMREIVVYFNNDVVKQATSPFESDRGENMSSVTLEKEIKKDVKFENSF